MVARKRPRPLSGIPCVASWLVPMLALVLCILPVQAQATPFAATVMDARTGQILHSVNDTTRLHPASLTKMMTLYVAFDAIRNGEITLDTMVRVSRRAASEPPSRLGLREGQRISMRNLIRAAALRSGNDAATAIAEGVSGSVEAFVVRMNRTAQAIGMTRTSFRNAHGLTDPGQLSTARDMSILGRQLYFDFPEYYNLFSRRSEDAGVARVNNTNTRFLDGFRGADGIKTGFTRAAGHNLTASAERNGVRIIVTVMGGRSLQHRHEQVVGLMERGFRGAPARVAVRRPARPDLSRVATGGNAAPSGNRAAGRVIRLQTAPARSLFPQPRRLPGAAPSEALLAAVQSSIETALAEPEVALAAPARSPLPPERPEPDEAPAAVVAQAAPSTDRAAIEIAAAEAAGFTVISAAQMAARIHARADAAESEASPDPRPKPSPRSRRAWPSPAPLPPPTRPSPPPRPSFRTAPAPVRPRGPPRWCKPHQCPTLTPHLPWPRPRRNRRASASTPMRAWRGCGSPMGN